MMFKKIVPFVLIFVLVSTLPSCGIFEEVPSNELERNTNGSQVLEFFEGLQDNEIVPFEITEKAKETLSEKEELFVGNNSVGLQELTDPTLEYRVLAKNISKHGDKLLYLPEAYVISIDETELEDGTFLSELHLMDANENSYYCLALSAYDNIFEEDIVSVYALPIGETSFDNISGGTTLAIMLAGCYIEKCEY